MSGVECQRVQIKQQFVNVIFIVNNLLLVNFIVLAFRPFQSVSYRIQLSVCTKINPNVTPNTAYAHVEIPVVCSVSLRAVVACRSPVLSTSNKLIIRHI